jgi:hypothetical protein
VHAVDGKGPIEPAKLKYGSRPVPGGSTLEKVRKTTLNSLIKNFRLKKIDILKMDTGGMEFRIFADDLSWLDQVENIVIKFYSEEGRRMCLEKLEVSGFSMFPILQGNSDAGFLFRGSRLHPADHPGQIIIP